MATDKRLYVICALLFSKVDKPSGGHNWLVYQIKAKASAEPKTKRAMAPVDPVEWAHLYLLLHDELTSGVDLS